MKTIQTNFHDVAEVSLTYHSKVPASKRISVKSSADAFEVFYSNWDPGIIEHRECFKVMLLNRAHKVLGISEISSGGIIGTVVDVKMIYQVALKMNATSIILCHNHPSGNLNPSEADISITRKIRSAGETLDLRVLDHIIINPEGQYFSFADEGIL